MALGVFPFLCIELIMSHTLRRPALLTTIFAIALALTAATQAAPLKGTYFTANNGTNVIGLSFDSTGTLYVDVDGQAFSNTTWESRADTVTFGPVTSAPEGYNCASGARYLWSIAEARLTFTLVNDDCEIRLQSLTSLGWTKG